MLNQVLKDSHMVASIENLKTKNPCNFNWECDQAQSECHPLILLGAHYTTVDQVQVFRMFLEYLRTFSNYQVQFYIDLRQIHTSLYDETTEQQMAEFMNMFGQPQDTYLDNQVFELLFIYSKCLPFVDDEYPPKILKVANLLTPENLDNRSTYVAVHHFRRFYNEYALFNFKYPNPFQVIRNFNLSSFESISIIEKVAALMFQNKQFLNYMSHHTSIFKSQDNQEKQLIEFLQQNQDLSHLIFMTYDLLNKSTDGDFTSTLLLKHISLQVLDPFIHPLSMAIFDFYEQLIEQELPQDRVEQRKYLPKITFLNMDGYDYEFNWKLLDQYQDACQYISVVDEIIQCKSNQSLMFDMITQDKAHFLKAKNSYIIPVRSHNNNFALNDMHFRHILDMLVYPLISAFQPQIVIFSYSFAYFNQESEIRLSSKFFSEIITNLCVLSNQKVIFLPRILSSGIQISDHHFEKELLKTDHKNILYYLNNYGSTTQQSFKFPNSQNVSTISRYADHSISIVKSNSFYELSKSDNHMDHYQFNQRKQRYMFEILFGFLESCRSTFLQEVKDKDKRMQDPNLQCTDLMQYKVRYSGILEKLHQYHSTHDYGHYFKPNKNQTTIYKLLSKQHQKTQKNEDSQFVSFLAQDLKDYIFVIEKIEQENKVIMLQVFLRHLKSPVYVHSRLTQYHVNYKTKTILCINVLSFKDIRELGIVCYFLNLGTVQDSYQICLVKYHKFMHQPQQHSNRIWAEIEVIQETKDPIVFRSLCFDRVYDNLYMIYGKDAQSNLLVDQMDIYNYTKNQFKTISRRQTGQIEWFPRAYMSSVVFSFEQPQPKTVEIWTFGGNFLGQFEQDICNVVEIIYVDDGSHYRSKKVQKEKIFPHSMRPMYASLTLSIQDQDVRAILIIGGSQNEMLVNVQNLNDCVYKFEKCMDDYYLVTRVQLVNEDFNPISCYQTNHNMTTVNGKITLLNDATEILGKCYRQVEFNQLEYQQQNNQEIDQCINELADPYSPYGILSVTSLSIQFGELHQVSHHKQKFQTRPAIVEVDNQIIHKDKVYQPFAQMHQNMKFYYKEFVDIDCRTRIIFQNNNDVLAMNENFGSKRFINLLFNINDVEEQNEYLKPCSMCISYGNNSMYLLTSSVENSYIYFTIYSYPINQLIQEINLQLSVNQANKFILNIYTIHSKVFIPKPDNVECLEKCLTCDHDALYLIAGNMDLKYQISDLDQILQSRHSLPDNSNNTNIRVPFDNPENFQEHGEPNHYMYSKPLILWPQDSQLLIIEGSFNFKYFSDVADKVQHDFKVWSTKFEYQSKDTQFWNSGILLLPTFLLKHCPIELSAQQVTPRILEAIQKRKLDLFLQNHNSDVQYHYMQFETTVQIVDYQFFGVTVILICAIKIQNFIQTIKLEFSINSKENRLSTILKMHNTHILDNFGRRHLNHTYIPKVTLLTTIDGVEIIEGYQIFEPANEFRQAKTNQPPQYGIIVKLKEQITVYELQHQIL